jgi:Flp pilus assembly protein TadG
MNRPEEMKMKRLLQSFYRFARDERGAILMETVIMLPILIWALMAMAAYWDIYRTINRQQKAAYAVADVIARQRTLTTAYVDAMDNVVNYMLDDGQTVKLRLTSVGWDDATSKFIVKWSWSPDSKLTKLTNTTLQPLTAKIPAMTASSTIVLLETQLEYTPNIQVAFTDNVGVEEQTLTQFIVTRPRFSDKICLISGGITYC